MHHTKTKFNLTIQITVESIIIIIIIHDCDCEQWTGYDKAICMYILEFCSFNCAKLIKNLSGDLECYVKVAGAVC